MTRVRPKLSRGQALIETAVTVLLLVLTTFTIFDFARFFWAVLAVQNGVAQGTRFAVTNRELGELDRDESIFFNVSAGATGSSGNPGDTIRVTVEQDFRFLTPVLAEVFGDGGELRFAASSTMRNEPEAD
jgi:Flp pilus assembly protein TadG